MNNIPAQYRHGDVLIQRRSSPIPEGVSQLSHVTLAEGEATGHSHTLERPVQGAGPVLFERDGQLYFKTNRKTAVTHQEHARIPLPRGSYEIIHQREYQPAAAPRRVVD